MTGTKCVVIDTNVWAVAEGMQPAASSPCVSACLGLLQRIDDGVVLAVDSSDLILAEYLATLQSSGSSGLPTKLANRLWRTRRSNDACKMVSITQNDSPPGSFEEIPPGLRDFDADDQKFLAVALAEGGTPPVFQALDEEWWGRRTDLAAEGLDVQFLCASDLLLE